MKIKFDQVPIGEYFIEPEQELLCIKIWDDRAEVDGTLDVIPVNPDDDVEINPK